MPAAATMASMCDPVTISAVAAAATVGGQIYQGEQARKAQNKAAASADQAQNKANPKKPNVAGMAAANSQFARNAGPGSTMLTGASGIDPAQLSLGRSTLLGG